MSADLGRARRRSTRALTALLVVLVLAAAILLARWAWQSRFPLVEASAGGSYAMGSASSRPATTFGVELCVDGDADKAGARIVAVRPIGVENGLRVVAFGVKSDVRGGVGTSDSPVEDLPDHQDERVNSRCGAGSNNMAVQVATRAYPASTAGFEIDYVVHGLTRTARAGGSVDLFAGPIPEDW